MQDGIYLIQNSLGSAGDAKTLITGAYNNRDLTLSDLSDNFCYVTSATWDWMGNWQFLQDDDVFWVTTHDIIKRYDFNVANCNWVEPTYPMGYNCPYVDEIDGPMAPTGCLIWAEYNHWCRKYVGEGRAFCSLYNQYIDELDFTDPDYPDAISSGSNYLVYYGDRADSYTFAAPTQSGDIVSVAVWAEVRGKVALHLNSTYGTPTTETHQYEWETLTYTTKPGGGAWAWSDLAAGTLKAGIKCYSIDTTTITGSTYTRDIHSTGACRRLKVVITTTTTTIELWPTGDSSATLQPVTGNYFEDFDMGNELCDEVVVDRHFPPVLYGAGETGYNEPVITSDLSEIAPRFSTINSVNVFIKFSVNSVTGSDSYLRPFIQINGTKYYGDSTSLNDMGNYTEHTLNYTWSLDPSTGEAWDYDVYKGIKFGCHAHLDTSPVTYCFLFQLYATTTYQERKEYPEFTQIDAAFISSHEEAQTPKLIAPDLQFKTSFPLAERLRIAQIRDGRVAFLGFVWSCKGRAGEYEITAKGYQEILKYRYFPNVTYSPQIDSMRSRLTMADILSADPPTHPLHSHMGYTRTKDNSTTTPDWVYSVADDIVITYESPCGLMWLINSYIPTGNGESTGKITELGGLPEGRPVFGLDRMISQVGREYSIYLGVLNIYSYTYPNIYTLINYPVYGPGNVCRSYGLLYHSSGFQTAGIRRLAKNTSSTCDDEEYYPHANGGLYVAPWPDHQSILIDYAMDTFIDLDEYDQEDKYLNEVLTLRGSADGVLSNIFEISGQEVTATPGWDGRLHLTAKVANGRGSETEPLFEFLDGANCHIETTTATEPPIDAAVGYDVGCGTALDLQQTDARFVKAVQTDRTGWDLDDYLDTVLDSDLKEWKITTGPEHSHLRPLDWISADDVPVRIRAIDAYPDKTVITAGKKLINLSEKFGEWRHLLATSDKSNIISNVEFTSTAASKSQAFTIKASDYARGDWLARFTLSWDMTVPNAATVATLTATPKAYVTIGGKVVHPGSVLLTGKSGSLTFDISEACSKSTSSDTENTLILYAVDRLTAAGSPTFYHTLTGKIEQLRAAAVLENA